MLEFIAFTELLKRLKKIKKKSAVLTALPRNIINSRLL